MTDLLRTRSATTDAMLAVFDDATTLAHALMFEAALARAEAALGLISREAAAAIEQACASFAIDPAELAREAAIAGTLAIPLVKRLRGMLEGEAAAALHRGATSQDLADCVLMRQAVRAAALLLGDVDRLCAALARLAGHHAALPAVGRTLLQDALPIGFGLRIAQWLAGISEAARRLRADMAAHAVVQFGGAAGTRAGLADKGAAVAEELGRGLGLAPAPPWQNNRGGIAAIGTSLGILIGTIGKMARDLSLLAQNAVAEAQEPAIPGRGGSSAMAHKRNPTGCQVALSAAIRAPGLVAGLLGGLPSEEERGLGGWQAEGPALADLFLLAAGAAEAMAAVAEGLEIDEASIARNLAAAQVGTDIGESAAIVAAILAKSRKG